MSLACLVADFVLDHAVNGKVDKSECDLRDLVKDFVTVLKRLMTKNDINVKTVNDARVTRALKKVPQGGFTFLCGRPALKRPILVRTLLLLWHLRENNVVDLLQFCENFCPSAGQ